MSTPFHTLLANFNGGEMTPLMDGRVDTEKYRTGCRTLENFIPRPYGGVMKRPGTEFCGEVKDSTKATRLISFRRSTSINYVIELGDQYIRFWEADGDRLVTVTSTYTAANWGNGTNYTVGQIRLRSDVTYICTAGHLSDTATNGPGTGSAWADVWNVHHVELGVGRSSGGNYYICVVRHSPTGTFANDVAAGYWHQTALFAEGVAIEIPSPYLEAELFQVQFVQLNDVMFLAHPNHFPRRLSRFEITGFAGLYSFILETVPFEFAPTLDVNETQIAVQVQFDGVPDWGFEVWQTSFAYIVGDRVLGTDNISYSCLLGHTSAAGNRPSTGGSYATYWAATVFAAGDRVIGSDGHIFTCHTGHTATALTRPLIGGDYATKWNVGTSSVIIPPWANATPYVVGQKARRLNVIYECTKAHTSNTMVSTPGVGTTWTTAWKISSAGTDLSGLAYKLVATEALFTSADVGSIWQLDIGTTGRYVQIATNADANTHADPLFIQGGYLLTSNWAAGVAPIGTVLLEESLDNITWTKLKEWTQSTVNDGNLSYEGEAPAVGAWYRIELIHTGGVGSASTYIKLEPASSVLQFPFRISDYTSATQVEGELVIPNEQLPPVTAIGVSTTLYRRPAFIEDQGFPRAVAFHDSRLWWAGTNRQPARLWGSAIDDFYNFLLGANDDQAIDVTLASTEANAIQWLSSHEKGMVIGTTAEEWTLDSGDTESVLTPSNLRARRRTRFGSEPLAPLNITDALLWVQRGGRKVREFAFVFEKDGYSAPEMTLLAEHFFRSSSIVQMAYQTTPDPIVWAVGSDGVLNGFSYDREQGITAWHRHRTGERESGGIAFDSFESVATIYGDNGADQVWFVIKRTISGSTKRYVERFQPATMGPEILDTLPLSATWETLSLSGSPCYVDCAHPGTGGSGTDMQALIGRTVYAAGGLPTDFVAHGSGVVDGSGFVILSGGSSGDSRWIGLPIHSRLRPMRLEANLQTGTAQARRWRLNRAALHLIASCGGTISPAVATAGSGIDYQGHAQPYSGQLLGDQYLVGDWSNQLDIMIQHTDPTPFNLLAAVLKVEVESE